MEKLTLNIYIISRLTHNFYARELRKIGLTMGQFPFLMGISENDGISQEKLSAQMMISKSTTAAVTRQLLEGGLIVREVDETDRRNFRLHLTERGWAQIPVIQAIVNRCYDEITGDLSAAERSAFSGLIKRVRRRSEKTLR